MPRSDAHLWDDTYQGPRWRYGLQYRPLALGNVPDGWILLSNRPHPEYRLYGTVEYARPLTDEEESRYSLVLLRQVPSPSW